MSHDIQAREKSGARAGVSLRVEQFNLMTRVLGCESDLARARLLGVDSKTLRRARQGQVGEIFIATTLLTLGKYADQLQELNLRPVFEELFELYESEAA